MVPVSSTPEQLKWMTSAETAVRHVTHCSLWYRLLLPKAELDFGKGVRVNCRGVARNVLRETNQGSERRQSAAGSRGRIWKPYGDGGTCIHVPLWLRPWL